MKPETCKKLWETLGKTDKARQNKYTPLTQEEAEQWSNYLHNIPDDPKNNNHYIQLIVSTILSKELLVIPTLGHLKTAWEEISQKINIALDHMGKIEERIQRILNDQETMENEMRQALVNSYLAHYESLPEEVKKMYPKRDFSEFLEGGKTHEVARKRGERVNSPLGDWRSMMVIPE